MLPKPRRCLYYATIYAQYTYAILTCYLDPPVAQTVFILRHYICNNMLGRPYHIPDNVYISPIYTQLSSDCTLPNQAKSGLTTKIT
jgi:hypothetical protein